MIIPHNLPAAIIATRRNSQTGDLLVIKIKVKLIMTKGWYTFKIVTIRTHDEIMMIIKEVMVGTRAGHPQVISAISTTHQPFLLNNIVLPLLQLLILIITIIFKIGWSSLTFSSKLSKWYSRLITIKTMADLTIPTIQQPILLTS